MFVLMLNGDQEKGEIRPEAYAKKLILKMFLGQTYFVGSYVYMVAANISRVDKVRKQFDSNTFETQF